MKQLSPGVVIEYHVLDPGRPYRSPRRACGRSWPACCDRPSAALPDRPLRVEVGARLADKAAELWLADDGPALSAAEQQQPFESFPGADQGLSPFMAALLVDGWGGVLRVRSEPGMSTRYTAVIPLRP